MAIIYVTLVSAPWFMHEMQKKKFYFFQIMMPYFLPRQVKIV